MKWQMTIEKIELENFKNYAQTQITFSPRVNCFLGPNGAGKTNILDALYYLSFCKSYFNLLDAQNILRSADYMRIQGKYQHQHGSADDIVVAVKRKHRKLVKRNSKEYNRLADHIGRYPLVMITPSDTSLIYEGSDSRRKFIDGIISQFDKHYLDILLQYNKAVQQRNALLKRFAERGLYDPVSIDIWDQKLIHLAPEIFAVRKQFVDDFIPVFEKYFRFIAGSDEVAHLSYDSQLQQNSMQELLTMNNDKDQILKYTGVGTHKDDINFSINNFPLKKFGSQGQQKSFIVAAKLAQYEYMKSIKGFSPVLLMDDIFDKLDSNRVAKIMTLVSENNFGQLFITDTHADRIEQAFKNIDTDKRFFLVEKGQIKKVYT